MTPTGFRDQRRQKFLPPAYFALNIKDLEMNFEAYREGIAHSKAKGDYEASSQGGIFRDKLNLLELHYTAGCAIEELKPLYADVIQALGEWNDAYRTYVHSLAVESGEDLRDDGTPLQFSDLFHFQMAVDVVSLGVLLGDGDAIRKVAKWVVRHRGEDMLFEGLIEDAVTDPLDVDVFLHERPYDPLLDAMYTAQTPAEEIAKLKEYLDNWYKSFEGLPWHNGHLKAVEGEYMPYYGYWSFEAAAVCIIHDIDDSSSRDHILYPKDLADWARTNNSLARLKPGSKDPTGSRRIPGGQPCPQAGWWHTPAKAGSRRYFKVGDVMPVIEGSAYGETF